LSLWTVPCSAPSKRRSGLAPGRRPRGDFLLLACGELTLMALALGMAAGLAQTPTP